MREKRLRFMRQGGPLMDAKHVIHERLRVEANKTLRGNVLDRVTPNALSACGDGVHEPAKRRLTLLGGHRWDSRRSSGLLLLLWIGRVNKPELLFGVFNGPLWVDRT